jgi:hypothetical protein
MRSVYFVQGEDALECLSLMETHGVEKMVELTNYLHRLTDREGVYWNDQSPVGEDDERKEVTVDQHRWLISWNYKVGYVGFCLLGKGNR